MASVQASDTRVQAAQTDGEYKKKTLARSNALRAVRDRIYQLFDGLSLDLNGYVHFEQTTGAQDQGPKKPSSFDFITKLLLPGLTLAAYILGQVKGSPPRLQWTLLAVTVFLVLFGFFFAPLKAKMRERSERTRDIRVTRNALPELRRLADNYAEFVNRGGDTFHYIVESDLCQGDGRRLAMLSIPPGDLWYQLSVYFAERAARHSSSARDMRATMMEFHHLVGSYNNLCVAAVFERLPQDLQAAVTPRVKSSLNGFQQRFVLFLKEYEDFVKRLEQASPGFAGLPRSFVRPKPL